MSSNKTLAGTLLTVMILFCGGCPFGGPDDGGGWCGGAGPNQSEVSLYVSDADTGAIIDPASFAENGSALDATCSEEEQTYPAQCLSYVIIVSSTQHTVVVSAEGYRSESVSFDASNNPSIHLSVELHKLAPRRTDAAPSGAQAQAAQ